MKNYTIEIDEKIMDYLKDQADPFIDTPNTVLHKLLFGAASTAKNKEIFYPSVDVTLPKALSQILEVIKEVIDVGHTRPEATRIVASRNMTAPQTIIDKYCRQLGKKASEIDTLLNETDLVGFRSILTNKFPGHKNVIDSFFNQIGKRGGEMIHNVHQPDSMQSGIRNQLTHKSLSDRKKRDTALESALKNALGKGLAEQFGQFKLKGQSQLVYSGQRVLCKYSSFHEDQSRWFWGVSKNYWQNWEQTDYLALIRENESQKGYLYVLLHADEALTLFTKCSESMGEKKINMRIYMDDGLVKFQEWKDFDVEGRSRKLNIQHP